MDFAEKNISLTPPESFEFPFPPYPVQHQLMTKFYECMEKGHLGIFESPTGTGKSLSIICSALKWLKDHEKREQEQIQYAIDCLSSKKDEALKADDDWLSGQASAIELTKRLHQMLVQKDAISSRNKRILKLNSKRKDKTTPNIKFPKDSTEQNDDLNVQTEERDEDFDLILEEWVKSEEEEEGEISEEYTGTKIIIASRTHSQLAQLVGEVMKSPYQASARVTTLASRQNYCINESVLKLKNATLINERCRDLQSSQKGKTTVKGSSGKSLKKQKTSNCKCPFMQVQNVENLRDSILSDVQDVEQLVAEGRRHKGCPYYASRAAIKDSQVVFVPYQILLHKPTRNASGLTLKDNIVIIDEAHNLLDAIGNMYSASVTGSQIILALDQLKEYRNKFHAKFSPANLLNINKMIFVVGKLSSALENRSNQADTSVTTLQEFLLNAQIDNFNMYHLVEFCEKSKLAQKLHGFAGKFYAEVKKEEPKMPNINSLKAFLSQVMNKGNKTEKAEEPETSVQNTDLDPNKTSSSSILTVISFLSALTNHCEDGRVLCHREIAISKGYIKFLLLNPAAHFSDIVKDARSVIVAGGTMQPIYEFKNRLFISAGGLAEKIMTFSCDHVVSPENVLAVSFHKGPTNVLLDFSYGSRNSNELLDEIGRVLLNICTVVPGGVVCFFPSYTVEKSVYSRLDESKVLQEIKTKKKVFREPAMSSEVDKVLDWYAKAIKNRQNGITGALMFSVVGGKLSEGLNFSDDLGRCVVVVGLPYPNIKSPELKEKMAYLNKSEGSSAGHIYYENLCMKAVNQCIGRAVRHKDDYATIVLLDHRYNRPNIQAALPSWIKESLTNASSFGNGFSSIAKFFSKRKQ